MKTDINKLEAVQRRAARFVMNDYKRDSSVTAMLKSLDCSSLASRRRDARLILLFKVIHGLVAVSRDDHLEQNISRTRAGNSNRFRVYSSQTKIFRSLFFPRTIPQWNKLPDSVIATDEIDLFKQNLKDHFD